MTSGTATSSNRLVFFVGVNTGFVSEGLPDERYIEFYRQRSSRTLHCAILGNVVVPGGHGTNGATAILSRDLVWTDVADAIKAGGTLPGIQLATTWVGYRASRKFYCRESGEVIRQARHLVKCLSAERTCEIFESFDRAGMLAVEHGFSHVQIHAAHGYLPNLLIDNRINPEAARARDHFSRLAQWLRSQNVETSIRLSLKSGDREYDSSGVDALIDAVATLNFDFIDLSSGFYNIDKRLIYPSRSEIIAARREESFAVARQRPYQQFIVSGRIMDANGDFPKNVHVGICRDLIANPKFLSNLEDGCHDHGKCHYFSRGVSHISCPRWSQRVRPH